MFVPRALDESSGSFAFAASFHGVFRVKPISAKIRLRWSSCSRDPSWHDDQRHQSSWFCDIRGKIVLPPGDICLASYLPSIDRDEVVHLVGLLLEILRRLRQFNSSCVPFSLLMALV
jgi:hypothetical protein